jgi:hypothetical protein
MEAKKEMLKEFMKIPGVGKTIAQDIVNLGFTSIGQLIGQDPEVFYERHNQYRGAIQDR